MCGLYGISGGRGVRQRLPPAGLACVRAAIFGIVFVRLLSLGSAEYVALGTASRFYMLILLLFCPRAKYKASPSRMQIRFENADLVAELQLQKASAEGRQSARRAGGFGKVSLPRGGQPRSSATAARAQLVLGHAARARARARAARCSGADLSQHRLLGGLVRRAARHLQARRRLHPPEHRRFSGAARARRAATRATAPLADEKGARFPAQELPRDREVRRRAARARARQSGGQCHSLHAHGGA